jgi:hypothetical protein
MTEQWKELKETIVELRDGDGTGTQHEVCKFLANYMDILEKQMQQPCEDTISRSDMLDAIGHGTTYTSEELQRIIKGLPPVTPQPKTSHWIDDKCSVCGKGTEDLIDSREWYRGEDPNFCPFCGIKYER